MPDRLGYRRVFYVQRGEVMSDGGRRGLQAFTLVLGLVPVVTGAVGLMGLGDPLYADSGARLVVLDSNLRFFAGVWLGLGLGVWWLVPRIERETAMFRLLWGAIFLGGVGRVLSWVFAGAPPVPFMGFTALEIVGAPLFVWWQARVARAAQAGL